MPSSNSSAGRSLLREALVAAVCLSLGAFALPAAIFTVGTLLLGPYTGGMGQFYQSFFQDLLAGLPRTWSLVVGPYVVVLLLRAIFFRRRPAAQTEEESSQPEARREPPAEQVRTTTRVAPPRRPVPPPASTSTQVRPSSPSQPNRPASKRIEPRISLD